MDWDNVFCYYSTLDAHLRARTGNVYEWPHAASNEKKNTKKNSKTTNHKTMFGPELAMEERYIAKLT